jgi:hypothetical protein
MTRYLVTETITEFVAYWVTANSPKEAEKILDEHSPAWNGADHPAIETAGEKGVTDRLIQYEHETEEVRA